MLFGRSTPMEVGFAILCYRAFLQRALLLVKDFLLSRFSKIVELFL
jgi:hypothetical protein